MSCTGECLTCGKCGRFEILGTFAGMAKPEARPGFGIAIDIGTTSVVLALFNLSTGALLARHSFMNPQRLHGPDVISRIHAANQGKSSELKKEIMDSLSAGIEALMNHGDVEGVAEIVIAGNTVMTHLLLGLSCESLGKFPFKPTQRLDESYLLFGYPARIMPWLGAFVGGDILAGLLHVLPRGEGCFLLIDLGTNGEIALYNKDALIVTATAAGPAFEGSGHSGGASAVLNDLAELLRNGVVDETGLLLKQGGSLGQKEIRDIQLAKSAVRSGLEILLDSAGLEYADLEKVYLAGGIGQAMKVEDAVTVGLLPKELEEKVMAIGNASLGGAARLLLSPDNTDRDMDALLAHYSEINLAEHQRFNELFMECLGF